MHSRFNGSCYIRCQSEIWKWILTLCVGTENDNSWSFIAIWICLIIPSHKNVKNDKINFKYWTLTLLSYIIEILNDFLVSGEKM